MLLILICCNGSIDVRLKRLINVYTSLFHHQMVATHTYTIKKSRNN